MILSFIDTFIEILTLFRRHCPAKSTVVEIVVEKCSVCITQDNNDHVRLYRKNDSGVAGDLIINLDIFEATRFFCRSETQFAECESVKTTCNDLYDNIFSSTFPFFDYRMQLRLCGVCCVMCVEDAECVDCLKCIDWVKVESTTEESTLTIADK
ncbi:hypothetical protein CYMTET_42052 [Cymbomonas tetramitiformis]|uniref:Uncharacterized protein n=1 Tax=Cymbomonas tetramitiformis TaxID=36881 RepID=A0AAE0C6U0_9CHLO|nr:hypothetical protein CYMTET_44669 [Cymbomonas tetramitiformis]KAK3248490.1 hypothetical protein CYMTET_42052 [Cymbomonas tetramitiformis]